MCTVCPTVQAKPTNTGEESGEESTGFEYCIVLYIQEFYRVELFRPTIETVFDRRERTDGVRNSLQGCEWTEILRSQIERVTEIDLAWEKSMCKL
jgi:hypothetical protein